MRFTIPKPPSVNHLYGHHGWRVYITAKGREWFDTAGWRIREQTAIGRPMKKCKLNVLAFIMERDDMDNLLKATQDLLTKMGIIEDDRFIMHIDLSKIIVPHRKEEKLDVEVIPL